MDKRPGLVNYNENVTPKNYKCSVCGARGKKMWRQYQTFLSHIELMCAECALKDQKKQGPVDELGYLQDDLCGRIDQIGWMIPAVPDEEGQTYWGYTSVPQEGVLWWRRLPT